MSASIIEENRAEAEARLIAEQEAAQAEYAASIYARTEGYRTGDPPSAEALGVDVAGLPPSRAALIRFAAWVAAVTSELEALERGRDEFARQIGVPAVTQAELDALIEKDKSGFLSWLRSGANKSERPELEAYKREQLQARLAGEGHEATVARDAVAEVERLIETTTKGVEILKGRHARFARAVLVEDAKANLLTEYRQSADRLQAIVRELQGLAHIAGDIGGFVPGAYRPDTFEVKLPAFGGVRPNFDITPDITENAARPWRTMVKALVADPRAPITHAKKGES